MLCGTEASSKHKELDRTSGGYSVSLTCLLTFFSSSTYSSMAVSFSIWPSSDQASLQVGTTHNHKALLELHTVSPLQTAIHTADSSWASLQTHTHTLTHTQQTCLEFHSVLSEQQTATHSRLILSFSANIHTTDSSSTSVFYPSKHTHTNRLIFNISDVSRLQTHTHTHTHTRLILNFTVFHPCKHTTGSYWTSECSIPANTHTHTHTQQVNIELHSVLSLQTHAQGSLEFCNVLSLQTHTMGSSWTSQCFIPANTHVYKFI